MIECDFLPVFFDMHQSRKYNRVAPDYANFDHVEDIWLNYYGLGKFEIYHFLYAECRDLDHFKQWLTGVKGADFLAKASADFQAWLISRENEREEDALDHVILSKAQFSFWEMHGYLKVSGLVDDVLCDQVKDLICLRLGVDLSDPSTWYLEHDGRQGLMLQLYQGEAIEAIRKDPKIFQLFAELYKTKNIIANIDKVSFNPPDTPYWQFKQNALHWDIDLDKPMGYYIQGLIYLDDVPEDRGPFTMVPGIHLQYDDWIKSFNKLDDAHTAMRALLQPQSVPGKKGDIILWRHTLPHAASANLSELPRFVQYLSFSKL